MGFGLMGAPPLSAMLTQMHLPCLVYIFPDPYEKIGPNRECGGTDARRKVRSMQEQRKICKEDILSACT